MSIYAALTMGTYERARAITAAARIIARGGWCLYEVCVDVPAQTWEPRALIFDLAPAAVADALEAEIAAEPDYDGRITGCDRSTLAAIETGGGGLCYLADLRERNVL